MTLQWNFVRSWVTKQIFMRNLMQRGQLLLSFCASSVAENIVINWHWKHIILNETHLGTGKATKRYTKYTTIETRAYQLSKKLQNFVFALFDCNTCNIMSFFVCWVNCLSHCLLTYNSRSGIACLKVVQIYTQGFLQLVDIYGQYDPCLRIIGGHR